MTYTARLQEQYRKKVIPALKEQFGLTNIMQVPMVKKVVINVGIGRIIKDNTAVERVKRDLLVLSGQNPSVRKAKKSVSSFKIRKGVPVGMIVTMRGKRMYDFLDRLVSIALPMSKDFRGIDPKNVDARGNLNLGIKEHNIFPEVTYESIKDLFSLQVTVTTTAKTHEQGIALLQLLGFKFKK